MLSSIHPLGERSRHNRWVVTVGAFTLAAIIGGALVGTLLGLAGSLAFASVAPTTLLLATAAAALAAGVLDLARVSPPGLQRQVNESWIGYYRGWVYGGAFGFELGTGVMTYVVTWGVFATFVAELFSVSVGGGALIGGVFGLGRAVAPLLAGFIDRPSRLSAFHQRMAQLAVSVRKGAAIGTTLLAVVVAAGVLV